MCILQAVHELELNDVIILPYFPETFLATEFNLYLTCPPPRFKMFGPSGEISCFIEWKVWKVDVDR